MEEVKIVGSRRLLQQVKATQYPEKVFIHDLLFNYGAYGEMITEDEYLRKLPNE